MGKYLEEETDVYEEPPEHPWADLFRDIPRKWERIESPAGPDGYIYRVAGPGTITLPTTPSDIARHVQLCGFQLVEAKRRVRRVDPVRGGKSFTSPGIWQDITADLPEGDPVHTVVQAAAEQGMTAAELQAASDRLAEAAQQAARAG